MGKKKLIFILIAVTFFAYLSSLGNPFIWDDEQFITSNQYVRSFDIANIFTASTTSGAGIVSNYYRPLTTLSFAIDYKIWSLNTFGFHLTNLIFHTGAGIVLFLLLLELGVGEGGSFFITLFFLIHPIQTEAVTYINSRGDSLYAFFLFLSLWLFASSLRGRSKATDEANSTKSRLLRFARNDGVRGIVIVLLFICSILSKETAMAGIGLYVLIFFKKNLFASTLFRRTFLVLSCLGACLVIYIFLRLTILNFSNTLNFYGFENEYTRSIAIRIFTFCKVLWIYLWLLSFPYPLHMERSVDLVRSILSPWVLTIVGFFGLLGFLGYKQLRKNNPWIIFGLLWFLIMLIPSSGIIPINGILYEHWLYMPMIGFFIVIYGLIKSSIINLQLSIKSPNTKYKILNTYKKLLITSGIIVAGIYIILTIRQNNLWSDPVTFYTYTLSFAPNSARLHNNLGMSYANTGNNSKAIKEYQKALSLGVDYPQIYNNLGNVQMAIGDYSNSEINLKKALQLSPQFFVAKENLIKLYIITKNYQKALSQAGNNYLLRQIIKNSY